MKFKVIAHRINTTANLKSIPYDFGVEIDVRDYNNELILAHDPWCQGETLEDYLIEYNHAVLIVNVKCEGIEDRIISVLNKFGISEYFLLDCSMPAIVKLVNQGFSKLAVRLSEFESIEIALKFRGLVDWVWVDCFTGPALQESDLMKLKGMNICIVSPDLHGRIDDINHHVNYYSSMEKEQIIWVCTKLINIKKWVMS